MLDQVKLVYPIDQQANLIILSHQARQEQLDSWQLGANKKWKISPEKVKIRPKNNKLVAKIVFVARCDIHLEICSKILSLKWSIFGLITVESSRTLFLCYAAVTPISAQSFQESTRRRFEKRRVEISLALVWPR